MKHNKSQIVQAMKKSGMIPVFNHSDIEVCKDVLDASYEGGIRVFEFTNREENSFQVFSDLYSYAQKYSDMILGIGTIFTKEQTIQFIEEGADFIVSPALIHDVINNCAKTDTLCIPGCGTITEVYTAHMLGSKIIKAFPGNVLTPSFIKAIKSVLPEIEVMPTGGVKPTQDNLTSWFGAGVMCVGMGSQLFNKKELTSGNFVKLTTDIKNTLALIQRIKTNNTQ